MNNWCIQGCEKLKELLNPQTNVVGYDTTFYYYNTSNPKDYLESRDWKCNEKPIGKIITVKEFKTKILNMKGKIIGYKLVKTEYRTVVAKITESQLDFNDKLYDDLTLYFSWNPYSIALLEKAGVLNLWFEPVYEQTEKVISVGRKTEKVISVGRKFDVTIKGKEIWHKSDNITNFVKALCKNLKGVHTADSFHYEVKEVIFSRTGCQNVKTKLSDWLNVLKEIE